MNVMLQGKGEYSDTALYTSGLLLKSFIARSGSKPGVYCAVFQTARQWASHGSLCKNPEEYAQTNKTQEYDPLPFGFTDRRQSKHHASSFTFSTSGYYLYLK